MVMGDGLFYLWNRNSPTGRATAVPGVRYLSVATGDENCGVDPGGSLFCWGFATPGSPFRVGAATSWQRLEAAIGNICGIQSGGNLFCWGPNGNGQMGSGLNASAAQPVAVALQGNWSDVSTGDSNATCGIRSGQLFCWGRNQRGMLGLGSTNVDLRHNAPQRVGTASDWSSVSVGEAHACGLRGGRLFCWGGSSANGQAADNTSPTQVGNATDWVAVAAGVAHSIGVRSDGRLFYWGVGIFGAFPRDSQTPIVVDDDLDWTPPLYADYDLSCATSAGEAYCFGSGPLGDGSGDASETPVRVLF
jgi:alpha-tubulin suppressor-like RCC1 family protein